MFFTSLIMDSSPHFFSFLLFLALALILLSVTPTFCASRQTLDEREVRLDKTGFKIELNHVDSGKNLTKHERLQRAMERGRRRLQMFSDTVLATKGPKIKSTVYPEPGEFWMKLSMGTPLSTFLAIMDTGSDLIWTQCKPCQNCFSQLSPMFDPNKSSSFSKMPCSSNFCKNLAYSRCNDGCIYLYTYGSGATLGILATETFTFDKVSIRKITFGCSEVSIGDFGHGSSGIVGLGRGPLSLVSQLDEPKFSYCLPSIDGNKTGTLVMGSLAGVDCSKGCRDIKTTPLIQNPINPTFYYLSLEGISVGSIRLPINESSFALNADGSGGLIIDSGTTLTYLEESAYVLVLKEFISQVKLPVDKSALTSTGLDLCFKSPRDGSSVHIPKLVFHFRGAHVDFPRENYFLTYSSLELICLAMGNAGLGGMSIFGNIQQQNMQVVYDLHKETLSFVST